MGDGITMNDHACANRKTKYFDILKGWKKISPLSLRQKLNDAMKRRLQKYQKVEDALGKNI